MTKKITPLRAIRLNCLACSGFQPKEVRFCTRLECPLYPYRFGHNPARKGVSPTLGVKTLAESLKTTTNEVLND